MAIERKDSPELGCRWHFMPESGREDGPNDAMMQNFKTKPYSALIREAVQNSLDAVFDPSIPVRVEITFSKFNSRNFENFFDLENHIHACGDYYSWKPEAVQMYSYMARQMNSDVRGRDIPYIHVSDSNTKGMWYDSELTDSPFYAFVRAAGVSSKQGQQSGGSFGFGKSAYFQLSSISTVFISSLTQDFEYVFEGVSWLCTHRFLGERVSSVGFYDNNDGWPVTDEDKIPNRFKRDEPGTSFFILGYEQSQKDAMIAEMVKEALKSFWLAILRNKLEIKIGDIEITKDTLDGLMLATYEDDCDNTRKSNYINPRPYYEALRDSGNVKHAKCFTHHSELLGECNIYLIKKKDATDKVIYMRRPLMLVYGKRTQTSYGVFGVFVCDNEQGDKILRELENPAHDEWKSGNWKSRNNRRDPRGEQALEEIQQMVRDSLTALFSDAAETALSITGLEEYLYIPEDLIDDDDDSDHLLGQPTGELKDDGTSITTDIPNVSKQREADDLANVGSVKVIERGSQNPLEEDEEEEPFGTGGHTRKKTKTKGGKPTAGNTVARAQISNEDGTYKTYLPVTFRVCAQNDNGHVYHNIIIHAPHDVINGELEIITIGEQSDDAVEVVYCDNGKCKDNIVTDVVLEEGRNTISILFKDNMRHSIKLKAYENK